MRIAPIALYGAANRHWDQGYNLRACAEAAAITHGHPLGWLSAAALGNILYDIMQNFSLDYAVQDTILMLKKHYGTYPDAAVMGKLLADTVKLATRAHQLPGMVIGAYVRGKYAGNLLDLFEPSFSPAFAPFVIDSTKIPVDFWQHTTECNKDCTKCNYCKGVLKEAKVVAF